jgi:hypothetical protein
MNCVSDNETLQEISVQRDIFRELVLLAYSSVEELYFMPSRLSGPKRVFSGYPDDTPISWRELARKHLGIKDE